MKIKTIKVIKNDSLNFFYGIKRSISKVLFLNLKKKKN